MYFPEFDAFRTLAKQGNLVPVYREILADEETPVTALMKFADDPYCFLLESVEGGEKWGRYTFLGTDPRVVFRVQGDNISITENGNEVRQPHHGDPLAVLKTLMERYTPVSVPGLPRFFGGAVGYLGYEMVRYFEPRLATGRRGEGGVDEAVFLVTDTVLIFDNVRHTVKVVSCASCDGADEAEPCYRDAVAKIDALVARLKSTAASRRRSEETMDASVEFAPNMSPETFQEKVCRAKEYITAGDIIQVVISQRFDAPYSLPPVDLYRGLRYVNPSPYLFFLKFGETHLIGSSPEVLVRLEDGIAEVRPIAGTRRRGYTEQEDRVLADELLQDPKERAEHVMLVDLGRNDLGRIARIGSVQVNAYMVVERYSHVMHLVSSVRSQIADGRDAYDVLKSAFPAGTLTGAPKIRAMEIIDELEPDSRGTYGGAVGYFSYTGNMDFGITIRTFLLQGNRLSVQAGAGIVADSNPSLEYEETRSKARGLIKAVQLAAARFEQLHDEGESR